jgi:hypothetical protein
VVQFRCREDTPVCGLPSRDQNRTAGQQCRRVRLPRYGHVRGRRKAPADRIEYFSRRVADPTLLSFSPVTNTVPSLCLTRTVSMLPVSVRLPLAESKSSGDARELPPSSCPPPRTLSSHSATMPYAVRPQSSVRFHNRDYIMHSFAIERERSRGRTLLKQLRGREHSGNLLSSNHLGIGSSSDKH